MQTILLVEDDPLMSDLYETVLVAGGFAVRKLTSGKAVVDAAIESKPALIILDLMMPDISGMDALALLKSNNKTALFPVVIFSNLLEGKLAEEAVAKGAVRYAIKIDNPPAVFLTMVKELVSDHAA